MHSIIPDQPACVAGRRALDLGVRVRTDGQRPVVQIDGEIDAYDCAQLITAMTRVSPSGWRLLTVDMTGIEALDLGALGVLGAAVGRAQGTAGAVALVGACDEIRDAVRVAGLTELLPTYATVADAIAGLDDSAQAHG
jgi:anti-anti-sigma factor